MYFAYKSNERNVALLRRHYAEGKHAGSGRGLLVAVLVGLVAVFVLTGWAGYELVRWLWHYFQ
ncbi:hypothetical protein [Hymenobacter persicinus]|uniref:Uncharacterized protein n=1 Tax=Hymenobacter persicinus TaxID=2025506 RepID=A0A4Q5LF40_9BACT|nr:hypothetical protein [Hymenobacter persicinus]RYU81256.1 hypothetical protein EWM57_06680 [Hymenobacter persicinus]